jgi:hypothetical protein
LSFWLESDQRLLRAAFLPRGSWPGLSFRHRYAERALDTGVRRHHSPVLAAPGVGLAESLEPALPGARTTARAEWCFPSERRFV